MKTNKSYYQSIVDALKTIDLDKIISSQQMTNVTSTKWYKMQYKITKLDTNIVEKFNKNKDKILLKEEECSCCKRMKDIGEKCWWCGR